MNVYAYQGKDRYSALIPVNDNQKLQEGKNYTVQFLKGMLIVAYPERDEETEFEFDYFVASQEDTISFVTRQFVSAMQILFDFSVLIIHVILDLDHNEREQERIFYFVVWGFSIIFVAICLGSCCIISCLSLITKKYTIPEHDAEEFGDLEQIEKDDQETEREEKDIIQEKLAY